MLNLQQLRSSGIASGSAAAVVALRLITLSLITLLTCASFASAQGTKVGGVSQAGRQVPVGGGTFSVPPPVLDPHPGSISSDALVLAGTAVGAFQVEIVGPEGVVVVAVTDERFEAGLVLGEAFGADRINNLYLTSIAPTFDLQRSTPASTSVTHDTVPPEVFIDYPPPGAPLTTDTVDVLGRVGDMLSGFEGMNVLVNGVAAEVNVGQGNNGTFTSLAVPLALGLNSIEVMATDALSNSTSKSIQVTRVEIPAGSPSMEALSGSGQSGPVGAELIDALRVRVLRADGTPFQGKVVTFEVIRSDGRLALQAGSLPGLGTLVAQVSADANGIAEVWWTLGSDAGSGNNRVKASSTSVAGTVFFLASGNPGPASRVVINSGNHQRGAVGTHLPLPLRVRVIDGNNPVAGVPVTFRVIGGGGRMDGMSELIVPSSSTGLAEVELILGLQAGVNRVEATFDGNQGQAVVFSARGLASNPAQPTTFTGLVLDNGNLGIGGARCTLVVNGVFLDPVFTDVTGRFTATDIPSGPAELFVDATQADTLGGEPISLGTFPGLHYEDFVVVPNAVNSLPMPVLLPRMNPANARSYSLSTNTVLEVEGIEGLRMIIAPGSMTLYDGTPAPAGTVASLNQVHFDQIPMPLPDGVVNPFAWTMQPGGATFDPPVRIEIPNMTGLAPGSVAFFSSFNHDTGRFDIIGTGSVVPDGSLIVTDPGSGITIAGWGAPLPPPPPTEDVIDPCDPSQAPSLAQIQAEIDVKNQQIKLQEEKVFDAWQDFTLAIGEAVAGGGPSFATVWVLMQSCVTVLNTSCVVPGGQVLCLSAAACIAGNVAVLGLMASEIAAPMTKFTALAAILQGQQLEMQFLLLQRWATCTTITMQPHIEMLIDSVGAVLDDAVGTVANQSQETLEDLQLLGAAIELKAQEYIDFLNGGNGLVAQSRGESILVELQSLLSAFGEESAALFKQDADVATSLNSIGLGSSGSEVSTLLALANHEPLELIINGRVEPFDSDGTYSLFNIPITGNGVTRVLVRGSIGDETMYSASPFFLMATGGASFAPGVFELSPDPPTVPMSLDYVPESSALLLEVGRQVSLDIMGMMSDGSLLTLSTLADGTWYVSTNTQIAEVDETGLVRAVAAGIAFITASNQGVSAIKRVDVVEAIGSTTATGFVQVEDGSPVGGVALSTVHGDSGSSIGDGSFEFPVYVPVAAQGLIVRAEALVDGKIYKGASGAVDVVLNGTTDAGVLTIRPPCLKLPGPIHHTGSSPESVVAADLNGDGVPDLAVANANSSSVSILLGLGDGSFAPQVSYTVGSAPRSVATGDVDGDGVLDLAVANGDSNSVSVLLGVGDGTFATNVSYSVEARPNCVAIGDLDGDGLLDLAVANGDSDSVSVLLGSGTGVFAAKMSYPVGANPSSIAIGDLNQDGALDLAVANAFQHTIGILLGLGNGTFSAQVSYSVGLLPTSVAIGDLNRDGLPDLVVPNSASGSISILLGLGDGIFVAQTEFLLFSSPSYVTISDLDADGILDLAIAGSGNPYSVCVLLGVGDGSFGAQESQACYSVNSSSRSVAIADTDGDGVSDLVVANSLSNSISVLLGLGNGTFAVQVAYSVGMDPRSLSMGDLNGDGVLDLAVANEDSNNVSVLLGLGSGVFANQVTYPAGVSPRSLAVGDFDGNGIPDLAVANSGSNSVSVLLGLGDGTFAAQMSYAVGFGSNSVVAGDLDGNGALDLVVAKPSSAAVSILLGLGNGDFASPLSLSLTNPQALAIGDLDGDEVLDLAVAQVDSLGVSVLLGLGDGTFAPEVSYSTSSASHSVAVGDLDGDGVPDLVVTNSFGTISVLLGLGDGTFASQVSLLVGGSPRSVAIGDFDGDGLSDIAVALSSFNEVSLLVGLGGGIFAAPMLHLAGSHPIFLATADLSEDGVHDLIVVNRLSNNLSVLLNGCP